MKKTTKITFVICMMLFILLNGGTGMAVGLVSVERFLEKGGLDAAVISNTDAIELFIHERDLDEHIFEMIPSEVVRKYAEHLLNNEPIYYGHLLEELPQIELTDRDLKELTHLAVIRTDSGKPESLLVNFSIEKAYLSLQGFVLNDVCYAEKIIPLTEELISDITKTLVEAGLPSAGKEYVGDTSHRIYTILLLAFEDGTVQYVSRGLGSDMPLSIYKVCQQIIMKFVNQ